MKTRLFLLCALVSATLAADLPYAGKWKVNLAKSDFGQTTVTYESLPGGEWQTTAFGVTYKFKMDGKEYPDGKQDKFPLFPVEPYFDEKLPQKIAAETGAKMLLFPPSVGGVKDIKTYFDLFDYDLNLIKNTLHRSAERRVG